MGKKKLDVSAFMGSTTAATPQAASKSAVTGTEGKEEVMTTSFRLRKSFVKQMRIYSLQHDLSTASLIEQAVQEYMQKHP